MRPAAAAPASVAALTAATSPVTKAVTRPLPTLSQPMNCTFAAFIIASLASTKAIKPLVSIMPSASITFAIVGSPKKGTVSNKLSKSLLLQQFHFARVVQIDRVAFVRVEMHFEFADVVCPHQQV